MNQAFIYPAVSSALLALSNVKRRATLMQRQIIYWEARVFSEGDPQAARNLMSCRADLLDFQDTAARIESDIQEGRYAPGV